MPFPDPIQVINPRTGNPFTSRANNAALVRAAEQGLAQYQNIAMKKIVQDMVRASTEEMGQALTIFGESLRYKFSSSREYELRNIHLNAAKAAQRSMVLRYKKIIDPRSLKEYRNNEPEPWRRYSGGLLEQALSSPNFFRASKDGILWGLKEPLDAAAPQWYRVNYGAGARGAGRNAATAFPADPSGLNLIPKTFVASGSYIMPRGVFGDIFELKNNEAGQRPPIVDISRIRGGTRLAKRLGRIRGSVLEFGPHGYERGAKEGVHKDFASSPYHPMGWVEANVPNYGGPTISRRVSRGFAGAFFIEAGLKRMGQVLPASYKGLARKWLKEASDAVPQGPISKIVSTPTANKYLSTVASNIEMTAYRAQQQYTQVYPNWAAGPLR